MNRHLKHSRLGASMMAAALLSGLTIEAAGAGEVGAPRQPVNYRLKEESLIDNRIQPAGATVSYDGLPAENLEPLCDVGRARYAEYLKSNEVRVGKLIAANQESAVGDPAKFAEAFAKALAEERAEHQALVASLVAANQDAALQLAEAAKNMAILATAISAQPAAAAPAEAVATSTDTTTDTSTAAAGETPARRTRG